MPPGDTALILHLLQIGNRDDIFPNARVEVKIRGLDLEGVSGLREPDGTINL